MAASRWLGKGGGEAEKAEKIVKKEWVVKNKPSQEEKEKSTPVRVDDSQPMGSDSQPVVTNAKAKDPNDNVAKEDEWQSVVTRSSKRLQKKKMEGLNQGKEVGGTSTSVSGNG
ncbi:hypothetical protein RIF29_29123 [Crotalaria pallida]|uniref:Uncharacterized protein n=1 Tax=Crotalaria pallida TaxID=3830 RepID=A0AAN9EE06_CROPI